MLCIRDKVWYRTDDLTESLWFLSLFCLQGQGDVGSGGHCNKLQERSAKVIVSIRSVDLFWDTASAQRHTLSVCHGTAGCCTYLVSTGFHTLARDSMVNLFYIVVPWCDFILIGCSMHLHWSWTGVPWCRVHWQHWCIPGVHWKAGNQFGARVRATQPAPQFPLLWPHGHSWRTGQGGGWGGPDPPHQDWGASQRAPSNCPPVQWLQAGGPTVQEVLGPFWELQQVEGGGVGLPEDVGPGGSPLHSRHLLLLPPLGCG